MKERGERESEYTKSSLAEKDAVDVLVSRVISRCYEL